MELLLKREILTNSSTLGSLYIDGTWKAYTLENAVRSHKIDRCTAIPAGTYTVTLELWPSKAASYPLGPSSPPLYPLLHGVPGFNGIFIHCGNRPTTLNADGTLTDGDTHGCILLGKNKGSDSITQSRDAWKEVFLVLQQAEDIVITVA